MAKEQLIKTTPKAVRMSYKIARGEQGVLTFEPYKSALLPLWRFKTIAIAKKSSSDLWKEFEDFHEEGDFVGMDMARKFIQMGYTRARRYANHKGGRKYKQSEKELREKDGKEDETGWEEGRERRKRREELPRGEEFEGKSEKEGAARVFWGVWQRCKEHKGYNDLREEFLKEQREWQKRQQDDKIADDAKTG